MIPETMRAVIKARATRGAELQQVPVPTIGPQNILVKVRATTICGIDLHIYRWDAWAQSRINPPMVFGHEFAGEVVAVGKGVTTVNIGGFVSGETHIVCGHCHACRTGALHICHNVKIVGVDRPSCFAEYIAIPPLNAWRNNPQLDPAVAAAQEPFGNAVHATLATDLATKTTLVTGCGPIGLLSVAIARAAEASRIFATDVNLMFETWYQTRALINGGCVDITPIITHRLPLESFEQAFEMMMQGEAAKVALLPQQS